MVCCLKSYLKMPGLDVSLKLSSNQSITFQDYNFKIKMLATLNVNLIFFQ